MVSAEVKWSEVRMAEEKKRIELDDPTTPRPDPTVY